MDGRTGKKPAGRGVHGALRLRQRVMRHGPETLEADEVLALLLDGATSSPDLLRAAGRLLRESGGLGGLARMETARLLRMRQVGQAAGLRISAALELSRRLQSALSQAWEGRPAAGDPAAAAAVLLPLLAHRRKEHFGLLLLDSRNRVEGQAIVSVGSLSGSLVHPREVFREALLQAAAAVILFHNHPSGDPTPSGEDVALTRRLARAGTLLGVEVLDHLILAGGSFVSLRERGLM